MGRDEKMLDGLRLRGSYTPLVTPFREGEVDLATYERLVEYQADGGSQGVVVAGTSGEPSTLTLGERNELLQVAVSAAAGRIDVVAATGSQSHRETVELTEAAERIGADAVLIVTPYYIKPPQRGLAQYFIDVGSRVDLPVLMYHIPGRAGVTIEIDTLAEIADGLPNFVGMKHASSDLGLVTETILRLGSDIRIFVGLEELSLPMLALGACGVMNAVGNLAPGPVADLWQAVREGDLREAQRLHYALFELNRAVFWDTNPIPIKYMMSELGLIDGNEHRLPMSPATPELEVRLDALLKQQKAMFDHVRKATP